MSDTQLYIDGAWARYADAIRRSSPWALSEISGDAGQ